MKKKPIIGPKPPGLRQRAEKRLRVAQGKPRPTPRTSQESESSQRLLHELQVHQVELEMQNTELRDVRDRMEVLLQKFTDLYDFAPVGYFSFDSRGRIIEVNMTGTTLLNLDRSQLLGARFARFIAPQSPPVFPVFLDRLFSGTEKPMCELVLLRRGGRPFWASCHGAMAVSTGTSRNAFRVVISDITAFKEAEDDRRRLEALAATNRELKEEIVRRRAVEEALKVSERNTLHLLKESQHLQDMLRHLSHRVLHAQEEERKRISRELHDQITQTLVGIHVQLESLARVGQLDPVKLRQRIIETQQSVETSVRIVREFARELRPSVLDDLGLIASLRSLLMEFTERSGVRVRFSTFAKLDQLKNDRCIVLYRVAQSALANVAEHARASQVTVDIQQIGTNIHMKIADDGQAFDVEQVMKDRHGRRLGFLGMRERLEMVDGSLVIESVPGQGTKLCASIPFRRTTRSQSIHIP